ncbi:MAG: polymer-forming cytoskeletal protein [Deltaproteobacteria bacterium]|nr:MAG: polymer-forming cytoskeletal protein [Deltaproteobacteria bacterium]TMB15564.1 MAG: polymer-forming cytoskeletal protein [Deltaproteobacteria bacterium]
MPYSRAGEPARRGEEHIVAEPKDGGNAWQEVRVSLGPDAEVTGKLSFVTATRIEGKLKGEVRASGLLIVGPQAIVHATVEAANLVVLGELRGQVQGAGRVEICAGGRLYGDVESKCLVVQEGAMFEGQSRMGERRPDVARTELTT